MIDFTLNFSQAWALINSSLDFVTFGGVSIRDLIRFIFNSILAILTFRFFLGNIASWIRVPLPTIDESISGSVGINEVNIKLKLGEKS